MRRSGFYTVETPTQNKSETKMSQATITNAADCTRCSKSYTSRGVARFHLREDETSKVSRGWILNFSMEMFWCIFILYEAKFKSITNVLYTGVNTEGT